MIQIFAGTKDNFDGRCFQSIRNLLPKRSKSLEDFAFDVGTNEVNNKPENKATKPSTNGWEKLRNSLKLKKYVEVLNNGKNSSLRIILYRI